jgi:chromosome segregation ATPase
MTALGKVLVLINFAMSVILVGVALAIMFSQRIQGIGDKGSGSPINLAQKKYTDLTERFKAADQALQRAKKNYEFRTNDLAQVEEAYFSHPAFYKKQLDDVENSKDNILTVARENGSLKLDDKIIGRVTMVEAKDGIGQPVQNATFYRKKIEEEHEKIQELANLLAGDPKAEDEKKKAGLIQWHELLTKKLLEVLPAGSDPPTRGLRVEQDTENNKIKQLEAELEYLEDTLNKLMVDNGAFERRETQMKTRKLELQGKLKGN